MTTTPIEVDPNPTAAHTAREGAGAVFVMPRSSTAWAGSAALWITVAGWAAAAERRFGAAWVVTPDATAAPRQALDFATPAPRPARPSARRLRAWVPEVAVTAAKDVRRLVASRGFRRLAGAQPWDEVRLELVWQHHDLFAGPGAALARRRRAPLVSFVHAPQVWEAARWGVRRPLWGRWIERLSERRQLLAADLVACVSEEVAAEVRRLGVPAERVLVTPMSVDARRFHPGVSGDEVRERYGLGGRFVLGWTGSFRRFHGLDLLVRAFAELAAVRPETRLLLVGDGPEAGPIRRLAGELGVAGHVVWTGAVPPRDVPAHVAAMDAAVVTARDAASFHYSPLKLREYMMCGKPVVVPAAGEMTRTLRDGREAVFYRPGSVADLRRALLGLLDDPARAREIAAAGRRFAAAEGTWDAQLDRLLGALRALPTR